MSDDPKDDRRYHRGGRKPRARTSPRKQGTPRSVSIRNDKGITAAKQWPKDEYAAELAIPRPATRGECMPGGPNEHRPCPFVGCKYNLYLEVVPETGTLRITRPDRAPWDMPPEASCALDIADRGGLTLEEVGDITNVVRERIRQIEVHALLQLKRSGALADAAA